jgi:hypothetical protein
MSFSQNKGPNTQTHRPVRPISVAMLARHEEENLLQSSYIRRPEEPGEPWAKFIDSV